MDVLETAQWGLVQSPFRRSIYVIEFATTAVERNFANCRFPSLLSGRGPNGYDERVCMHELAFVLKPLIQLSGPAIKITEGIFVVGRATTCNFVLPDASVSRCHAEISVNGTVMTVRDLNSRNGTYVDDKRVESSQVLAGQCLRFGGISVAVSRASSDDDNDVAELETRSVESALESFPTKLDKLPLSAAECRVFDLLLEGCAEKEIARRLKISRHTVHSHVREIYRVLEVRSRAELLSRFVVRPDK